MTHAGLPLFPDDAGQTPGKPTPAADSPHRPPPPSPPAADSAGEPPAAENTPSATPAAPCPSPSPADGLAEGLKERDRILAHHARNSFARIARRMMLAQLLEMGQADADDLHPFPAPEGTDLRFLGGVGHWLFNRGIVEGIGINRSRRRKAHARKIERWKLIDRAAAERLLAELDAELSQGGGGASAAD